MSDAPRRARVPVGIPGVNLTTVERELPADEPPPLAPNAELSVIGRPARRLDGDSKVTGRARFTADVQLPGMLHGRMVNATVAHARIRAVDTSAAERVPGVRAVHVLDADLGAAAEQAPGRGAPRLTTVRYVGQPVAAVAAVTAAAADEAARLVRIDYEPLPAAVTLEAARAPGAPAIFAASVEQGDAGGGGGAASGVALRGNVRGPYASARGDVARGFAEAAAIVEGEFRTQVQTHSALETHGAVADWRADGLTVWIGTQHVAGARNDIAAMFGLPRSRVRVISEYTGGGFGAKYGPGNYGVAAIHLSRKAGAPVRMMLDRREEHLSVGNRPSSVQRLRVGARRDGTLTAIELEAWGTAGVALGASVGGVAEHLYRCPNFRGAQHDVFTNAGPGAAFRAPGAPQGIFALEQLVDALAERLGMDPLVLRDRNDENLARREERRIGAERFGWSRRRAPGSDPGPVKRGVGVAQADWPRIVDEDASAEVRVWRDGSVEVLSSGQDIGTGTRTVYAQVAAEELGLAPAEIAVRVGDSQWPAAPPSGGSRLTASVTPAVRRAAHKVGLALRARAAERLGVAADALVLRNGRVEVAARPGHGLAFREAAALLPVEPVTVTESRPRDYPGPDLPGMRPSSIGGVQFAEVSVDTGTGVIRVERIVAVHDCGRPINPLAVRSQVNGGIIHGLSWALYEDRVLDARHGHVLNANLDQYRIALAREVPRIEVVLLEQYAGRTATDAIGVAEPANIATAAAIANAVYNATGVRLRELPMTPARVLAALGRARVAGR